MPRLFKCLQSPSKDIRRTVVTVLSHLILNDYVKIKNEIVDFLYLVKDSENEIQVLVQIFFHQLNEKNKNAIQNVIPEAVTRLSSLDEEGGVSDIMFEELSRFLLGFIFKETDSELLIDKFIKRLQTEECPVKEASNIFGLIAQMAKTERAINKILENIKLF